MISESSISTPSCERNLEDFSHLFSQFECTASPPYFSNIVLKTAHNANIDLNVLFNILPIVKISPEEIKKTKGDFNEVFISVRKFPKNRGWREPSAIKSFLDLDFYLLNRNFHIKVSTNNISIVGGGSLEISKYLIETLYHHFRALHNKWTSYSILTQEKKDEIFKMFLKKDIPASKEDLSFYDFLDSIIDRNEEDVTERLCDLRPLVGKDLYESEPQITKLVNCNSVYNYRLPEEISLAEKANLLHKKGYKVMFHPAVIVKRLKVTWTTEDNKTFGFSIQNIGTIKQNSPYTHEESIMMYEKLVTDLGYLPYKEGYKFATKSPCKTLEHVEKNKICKEILRTYLRVE